MKNTVIKSALSSVLLLGFTLSSHAQSPQTGEGSWVVETNLNQKNFSIVRFYDQQGTLIYEEKLNGVYLDVSKPRTKRILNKSLASFRSNTVIAGRYYKNSLSATRLARH